MLLSAEIALWEKLLHVGASRGPSLEASATMIVSIWPSYNKERLEAGILHLAFVRLRARHTVIFNHMSRRGRFTWGKILDFATERPEERGFPGNWAAAPRVPTGCENRRTHLVEWSTAMRLPRHSGCAACPLDQAASTHPSPGSLASPVPWRPDVFWSLHEASPLLDAQSEPDWHRRLMQRVPRTTRGANASPWTPQIGSSRKAPDGANSDHRAHDLQGVELDAAIASCQIVPCGHLERIVKVVNFGSWYQAQILPRTAFAAQTLAWVRGSPPDRGANAQPHSWRKRSSSVGLSKPAPGEQSAGALVGRCPAAHHSPFREW